MSEKALASAVILQAIEDFQHPEPKKFSKTGKVSPTWNQWRREFEEAKSFLTSPTGEWAKSRAQWCHLAGIDPDSLLERVTHRLASAA